MLAQYPNKIDAFCRQTGEDYITAEFDLKRLRIARKNSRNFQQRRPGLYKEITKPITGSKAEPETATAKKIKLEKTRITMTVLAKRVSQISIGPAYPARLAAARLRRACGGPILAAPPVRAIQTSILLESKNRRDQITLDYEGKSVYKERN